MENEKKSFLGTGWKFPPEFNEILYDVERVSEEDDIQESLEILLSTSPGERTMYPEYGCGIRNLVFESMDESVLTLLKQIIKRAVLFFEPRVELNNIDFDTEKYFEGVLGIILNYTVIATNTRSNLVFPFYLKEGTDIQF